MEIFESNHIKLRCTFWVRSMVLERRSGNFRNHVWSRRRKSKEKRIWLQDELWSQSTNPYFSIKHMILLRQEDVSFHRPSMALKIISSPVLFYCHLCLNLEPLANICLCLKKKKNNLQKKETILHLSDNVTRFQTYIFPPCSTLFLYFLKCFLYFF